MFARDGESCSELNEIMMFYLCIPVAMPTTIDVHLHLDGFAAFLTIVAQKQFWCLCVCMMHRKSVSFTGLLVDHRYILYLEMGVSGLSEVLVLKQLPSPASRWYNL